MPIYRPLWSLVIWRMRNSDGNCECPLSRWMMCSPVPFNACRKSFFIVGGMCTLMDSDFFLLMFPRL